MEETQKEKQAVPEPIDIITLLHDVLRGVKKLWWACLLLTVLCAAGSWYTAKRAYRPLYRALLQDGFFRMAAFLLPDRSVRIERGLDHA